MARLEGMRIKNYKVLRDVTLGKLWSLQGGKPLSPLTAVIGKNGVGKSTLFDAFGFLADCLKVGVEEACDARGRGGFRNIQSLGATEPIQFELYYREEPNSRPITYELAIAADDHKRPFVLLERLRQRRKGQSSGRPFSFLLLESGKGYAWKGQNEGASDRVLTLDLDWLDLLRVLAVEPGESTEVEQVELDRRRLGIATLGSMKQHPRISSFREFIEGWYLSYFSPDAARSLPLAGPQRRLSVHGDNLGNVVQFMEREHPEAFKGILERIAEKIPGVQKIDTARTEDGRLLLRFNDKGFQDPFYAQQMSDGTLKVFAYLLLLEDPTPPPFLCIEEPENGLYHKLLQALAQEFRSHARKSEGSQVFVTTHQPHFVDALSPEEVWVLDKGPDGFSTIKRASDDPLVVNMAEEGLTLGSLWYSDYLDPR